MSVNVRVDVILEPFRGKHFLQWTSNKFYTFCMWVYSFSCPTCKAHVPSVACPSVSYFSTLSQKQRDFRKKKKENFIENTMCVLIFCTTLYVIFLILKNNSAKYHYKDI